MSFEERIAYAQEKREEAVSNGTLNDIVYWNGYINGIEAVKRDLQDG